MIEVMLPFNRDLTQQGREHQQERYKTIYLITEYNNFMWKCKQLAPFHHLLQKQNVKGSILWFSRKCEHQSMNHIDLCAASKLKFLTIHVDTPSPKIEKNE